MQAFAELVNVEALKKASENAARVEADGIAEYARLAGIQPEALRDALARRSWTLWDLESLFARHRDPSGPMRALWAKWQAQGGAPVPQDLAGAVGTVPERLLDADATASVARHPQAVRWLARDYDPRRDGARLVVGPTDQGTELGLAQAALRLAKVGFRGVWWSQVAALCNSHRQHRRTTAGSRDVANALECRWLVLTRLGAEGPDRDGLVEVVGERFDRRRLTCVVTPLSQAKILDQYGGEFVRQIVESGAVKGKVLDLPELRKKEEG